MATDDDLPPYELYQDYIVLGGDRSPGLCVIRNAANKYVWQENVGWGLDGASLQFLRGELAEFEVEITITTQSHLVAFDDFYKKWLSKPLPPTKTPSKNTAAIASSSARVRAYSSQIAALEAQASASGLNPTQQSQLEAQLNATSAQRDAAADQLAELQGQIPPSRAIGIYHPRLARLGITSVVVLECGQFVQGKTSGETCVVKFKQYRPPRYLPSKPNGSIPGVAASAQPAPKDALDEAIAAEIQRNKNLSGAVDNLRNGGSLL